MIQKRAFKIAFPNLTYSEALNVSNTLTLNDRCDDKCKAFFISITNPKHRLHNLLPTENKVKHLRSNRKYTLPKVNTNRLKKSPIFYGVFNYQ